MTSHFTYNEYPLVVEEIAICDEVEFYLMKNSEPFLEGDNASTSQRMLDEFENLMGGAQK